VWFVTVFIIAPFSGKAKGGLTLPFGREPELQDVVFKCFR
jgi:hypothetical protein